MGVLRREKRLLSVSLHSVKGHSFSFLPTALACTYFSDNEEVSSFAFTSWTNSVKWDKLFKIGDLTYGVTIANVFCSFFGTICLHTYSGCILVLNSKSMGMHLTHNIRILKIKSKKIFLRSHDCIRGEVSGTLFKNQLFMLYGVETS